MQALPEVSIQIEQSTAAAVKVSRQVNFEDGGQKGCWMPESW